MHLEAGGEAQGWSGAVCRRPALRLPPAALRRRWSSGCSLWARDGARQRPRGGLGLGGAALRNALGAELGDRGPRRPVAPGPVVEAAWRGGRGDQPPARATAPAAAGTQPLLPLQPSLPEPLVPRRQGCAGRPEPPGGGARGARPPSEHRVADRPRRGVPAQDGGAGGRSSPASPGTRASSAFARTAVKRCTATRSSAPSASASTGAGARGLRSTATLPRRRLPATPPAPASGWTSTPGCSGCWIGSCTAPRATSPDARPRGWLRPRRRRRLGLPGPARSRRADRGAARRVQPRGSGLGPTPFDPARLRAANYQPLVETLRAAMAHGGGVRIDHILGFFRMWWVPDGCSPAEGAYVRYPANELLDVLAIESRRAAAVVVGEDLGTVEPGGVRAELAARRVLSYRLLWFEDSAPRNGHAARWPPSPPTTCPPSPAPGRARTSRTSATLARVPTRGRRRG